MLKTIKRWLSHHGNRQIGTYIDRWYIVPPQWKLPVCVRLQHIKRADNERIPHNHPYAFKSIVVKGWYDEQQVVDHYPGESGHIFRNTHVRHGRFKLFTIAKERFHRIVRVSKGGVWTLIWHPRNVTQEGWGYLNTDGSYITHDDYVRPPGYDLPYKKGVNRDGPTGNIGPGGPAGATKSFTVEARGRVDVVMPQSGALDFSDTHELLDQIKDAAQRGAAAPHVAIVNPNAVRKGTRI